jgi:hypothetical protein
MIIKVIIFTLAQYIPLYIWNKILNKNNIKVDWRLVLGYFIFGSWFGMYGELFLFKFIDWIFKAPIWEYRTFPIHDGITSSYGPIMWGMAAVYICFHKNYQINPKKRSKLMSFLLEAGFLLVLETLFNFLSYLIFDNYFFYYFVPDLWHWTSFTNLPFWWVGYHVMVKYAKVLYKEEKLNFAIAAMMLIIIYSFEMR